MISVRPARIRLPVPASATAARAERNTVLAVLAAVLLLQLELVFNRPVNWDEFYHLSQVHALHQGRMSEVLQVLHIRALGWVALLPLDEIGQIRVARLVMFAFEAFTLIAIYAMARHFAQGRIALLGPLLYLAAGNVFQHGMSFRADPLVTALLMGALWLLLVSKLGWNALGAIAALVALAGLATIKAVLIAPAFAGLAWYRMAQSKQPKGLAARLTGTAILTALLFAALVAASQAITPPAPTDSAAATVKASRDMLLAEGLFPRWHYLLLAIGTAPLFALAFGAALARPRLGRDSRIALIGLILPLASVVFYRNAYPYFYAFILAPVAVGIVPGIAWLARRYTAKTVALGCLLGAVILSISTPRAVLAEQRQVLSEVHRVMPSRVAYFDFSGMVSAFPKSNVFMTTWGQTRYRNGETESYAAAMERLNVPLLLANNEVLQRNQSAEGPAWELLPADAAALRAGYVQHWGPIWVAGRRFVKGSATQDFSIHADGLYRLEGAAALIDGKRMERGWTMTLAKGNHRFAPLSGDETVLRWGDYLPRPAAAPPVGIPFKDF